MKTTCRKATQSDIDRIVTTRVMLIDEDSGLTENEKNQLYTNNKEYIETALTNGIYFAYLAYDGEKFIGTSSACLYAVLSGKKLPKGKQALYKMFMFCQNIGVAMELIRLTVAEALDRGYTRITLSATQAGAVLFSKCGFVTMPNVGLTDMVYHGDSEKFSVSLT